MVENNRGHIVETLYFMKTNVIGQWAPLEEMKQKSGMNWFKYYEDHYGNTYLGWGLFKKAYRKYRASSLL